MWHSFLGLAWQLVIPVALVTYLLVGWMLQAGHLQSFRDRRALKAQLRAYRTARKQGGAPVNPLLGKWMRFGGGFYGIVAMYTFFVMEPPIVVQLAQDLSQPANWSLGGLIAVLVAFVISSIMQFVSAAVWFAYWFDDIAGEAIGLAAVLLYGGYVFSARLAGQHHAGGQGHMRLWAWLDGMRRPPPGPDLA